MINTKNQFTTTDLGQRVHNKIKFRESIHLWEQSESPFDLIELNQLGFLVLLSNPLF